MNRKPDISERLKDFMESESRSCSMDFGCITPLYVYRIWGGQVSLDDIERSLLKVNIRSMVQYL